MDWLILSSFLWTAALAGQTAEAGPSRLVIPVDDHRPLAALARELEKRYPVIVTYEEGPWVAAADIEDITRVLLEAAGPGKPGPKVPVLAPRRVAVSFEYASAPGAVADPKDLLAVLLRQYEAAGGPGQFRVEGEKGIYHLIPDRLENANGEWADASPVFSTPVTLVDQERTVDDTLDEIVAQLNHTSPVQIGWGFVPLNLFHQNRVRIAADGVPARVVLRQILEQLPRRVSWLLNHDPTTRKYYLSFLLLPDPS